MKKNKKYFFWRGSLSFTLLVWFLVVSIVPLIILSVISYNLNYSNLENSAIRDIENSSSMKSKYINNWFSYRKTDISSWSQSKYTTDFLIKLSEEYKKSNLNLDDFIQSYAYVKIISNYESEILRVSREYNYIYDIFLINIDGDILYTVAKENDLGTNISDKKYSKSKFVSTVRKTLLDGEIYYSDLEFYEVSKDIATSFLTAPLIDENGNIIGVYALQLKLDKIFNIFSEDRDIETGYMHYLVGEDAFLRNSIDDKHKILEYKIESKQFSLWNKEHGLNGVEKTDQKEHTFFYESPFGYEVIGLHKNINILDVSWVLISEIKKELIVSSVKKRINIVILFFIITIIFVIVLSIFISGRISRPIKLLSKANIDFSAGKRDIIIKEKNSGELGALIKSFNEMVGSLKNNEEELLKQTQEANVALEKLNEQKLALDSHSIVAVTDVKGTITFVNDKFVEISGYSRSELIGKNHRLLNSGAHSKEFWHEMYKTISSGEIWNAEICNVAKNMDYYWVNTTIVPFMKESKVESYIAIRTDITNSKKLGFELTKAKEIAENSVRAKAEFLASMSHEIRTPMNGVIGMLDLLSDSELNDKQFHQLHLAQSSANSLLTLINDILDFSKVEAGKLELEEIDFNLRDELGDFVEAIAYKAQEKDVEIILDTSEIDIDIIKSDPGRIRQLLTNMVGNAIKFTSYGYILIKASLNMSDIKDMRVEISVIDTGIGIPEEKIDNLFDKFTQVDNSTTRKYGGTGLGLAIVKKLTELMDGSVKVQSTVGEGTTFSINIGVKPSENSSLVKPDIKVVNKRIIIVDNNKATQDVISAQLKLWGLNVSIAYNAKSALKLCKKEMNKGLDIPFDMMFIDMNLPKIDGVEFAKDIRKNSSYKKMKLVVMTQINSKIDINNFKQIGINASFPKPITTKNIFYALNILVNNDDDISYKAKILNSSKKTKIIWPKDTNILLVDDNDTNQAVAEGMLSSIGLSCDIVSNGKEVLEILNINKKLKYTIVLMDCQMPIMDGYEATREIRKGSGGKANISIPIIAMTANAMQGDREKCIAAGMDDYISKPINLSKLKEMLKKYILKEEYIESDNQVDESLKPRKINKQSNVELRVWDEEDALARVGGSKKILNKIIEIFLEDINKQIDNLENSIKIEDMKACELNTHTIKGSSANISAIKLQNLSGELEIASRNNNLQKLKDNFLLLKDMTKEIENTLKKHMKNIDEVKIEKNIMPTKELLDSLGSLKIELENASFIDTDSLKIFNSSFNEEIMQNIEKLKKEIDHFDTQKALTIIDEIIKNIEI